VIYGASDGGSPAFRAFLFLKGLIFRLFLVPLPSSSLLVYG
jgi:hypothetical protein